MATTLSGSISSTIGESTSTISIIVTGGMVLKFLMLFVLNNKLRYNYIKKE